jgi:hypothetical protein
MTPFKASKHLLRNPEVKRWYTGLRAESHITADAYLRRLNNLVRLTKLEPRRIVEKCRGEGAGRSFLVDVAKELERRGTSRFNMFNYAEALASWLQHNNITAPLEALGQRPKLIRTLNVRKRKSSTTP